jgi:hypothetical protein
MSYACRGSLTIAVTGVAAAAALEFGVDWCVCADIVLLFFCYQLPLRMLYNMLCASHGLCPFAGCIFAAVL